MLAKWLLVAAVVILAGCSQTKPIVKPEPNMNLTSPSFENNGTIPPKFTCNGTDISPELQFSGVPPTAKSLALIVDDPDAPSRVWVHWVVFNIDPKTPGIPENSVPEGAVQGMTDFRTARYGGPCPPSGTHRYMFKLYALDTMLSLDSTASKSDIEAEMEGHILAQVTLTGRYQQKK